MPCSAYFLLSFRKGTVEEKSGQPQTKIHWTFTQQTAPRCLNSELHFWETASTSGDGIIVFVRRRRPTDSAWVDPTSSYLPSQDRKYAYLSGIWRKRQVIQNAWLPCIAFSSINYTLVEVGEILDSRSRKVSSQYPFTINIDLPSHHCIFSLLTYCSEIFPYS